MTVGATGQVGSRLLCQGGRGSKCTFSGYIVVIAGGPVGGTVRDSVVDTKCKPGTRRSAKREPNDGMNETGTLRGEYCVSLGGVLVEICGRPKCFGVLLDGGARLV